MQSVVTGVCRNFTDVLVARFFLGFVESVSSFPTLERSRKNADKSASSFSRAVFLLGAVLMLSKWYTKKEIALRYTILFCGVSHEHKKPILSWSTGAHRLNP